MYVAFEFFQNKMEGHLTLARLRLNDGAKLWVVLRFPMDPIAITC